MWLDDHHPDTARLGQLDRQTIEEFLAWNHKRPSRGRRPRGRPVSIARQHGTVSALKSFFDETTLWGWAERPTSATAASQRPAPSRHCCPTRVVGWCGS